MSGYAVAAFDAQQGMVADRFMPAIGVTHQSDRYFVLDPGSFFIDDGQSTKRAPQTVAKRVQYNVSSDGYYCDNYALQHAWGMEEVANMDPAVRGRQAVDLVVGRLKIGQEVRCASLLTSISNIGSGKALTGTAKWSNYAGSDPIGDVNTGQAFIRAATGLTPNTAIIDTDTMAILRRHPALLDLYKYTSGGQVSDQQIADAFRIKTILEASGIKNVANEGQAKSLVNIWGNVCVLGYVPPGGGGSFQAPTAGAVRFQWNNNGIYPGTFAVERTMYEGAGSIHAEVIETGYFQAEKVTAPDLIYALTGVL
ncbi:MAG: hypothetical protein HC889_00650 [Synechococcaceae cyanobacterium SM1_2_3]|nr:hypothetical protein [Synechococcaceae cyanobacterium SM1_2_3]